MIFSPNRAMSMGEERTYRGLVTDDRLQSFRVAVKETDLLVKAERPLIQETRDLILKHRLPLERYAVDHPEFLSALAPLPSDRFAPPIVGSMIKAGQQAGVGPMASVAGALAEYVGKDLLKYSQEVIVENGGDIFIRSDTSLTVAISAGQSGLSTKIGVRIYAPDGAISVCTSSGTVGHSISLGRADAAVVISKSTPLADAAATFIGNLVRNADDMSSAIQQGKRIKGVLGIVVIMGEKLAVWGLAELVTI